MANTRRRTSGSALGNLAVETGRWEDESIGPAQSGETRHSNDINVTEVQFLGQRSDRLEDVVVAPEEYQEAEADLPF